MLDAQEDFVAGGGRLIYMGGNGYYWVVGFDPENPACMEVRKLDSGMRPGQPSRANITCRPPGKRAACGVTVVVRRKS